MVLVLTEDRDKSAPRTIAALAKSMCRKAVSNANVGRLQFDPPPEDNHRHALSGNRWKSEEIEDQRAITELVRAIAAHLASEHGFVIFHFDGDRPYADRASAENPRKFQKQIVAKLHAALALPPRRLGKGQPALPTRTSVDPLSKLLIFTPYYNLEAWTFYNTARLLARCKPHERAKITSWAKQPGQTEEEVRIGELVVGKGHNLELAEQGFPAKIAVAANKSFSDTVNMLKANAAFMAVISPAPMPPS
jgi:hypothetical protein